jgi:hypothetical protein
MLLNRCQIKLLQLAGSTAGVCCINLWQSSCAAGLLVQ